MDKNFFIQILPETASTIASWWDNLFYFVVGVSLFFFIPLIIISIYFVIKYRKKPNQEEVLSDIHGNTSLEIFWTVIPTIIVLIMFAWGWFVYKKLRHAPQDAMEVQVIGKQWMWQFNYENGKTSIGDLFLPENQRVKLIMTSQDVIHSFFVPNFRTKSDVVPGLYSSVWFETKGPGEHIIYCSEYCGAAHSNMLGKLKILSTEDWQQWIKEGAKGEERDMTLTAAERGAKLTQQKGCNACHSVDGSILIGPSFKDLWQKTEVLEDDSTVLVDANYIRNKILNPNQGPHVKGYPKIMPAFQGLLSEEEILDIIAYIKSLKN